MNHFAYIDESGTRDDQLVMTVGLVVLQGQFASNKLRNRISAELTSAPRNENKAGRALQLHYCDMGAEDRTKVAKLLEVEKIHCYASYHYHEGEKKHEERFQIYTEMLKSCIRRCLVDYESLEIVLAAQGGANSYRADLLRDLEDIEDEMRQKRLYRKVRYDMKTNANSGIQIADFYAGTVRDYFIGQLTENTDLANHYSIIENHYVELIIQPGVTVDISKRG